MTKSQAFQNHLSQLTQTGSFFNKLDNEAVQCFACAHICRLKPGQYGVCKLRYNQEGVLMVPVGYVAGLQLDPIEKKPFNHFLPGALTLSFGMVGCNFTCDFCQNWLSAQALNDTSSRYSERYLHKITAKEIVESATSNHVQVIASTYNEPLITSEWAIEIFELAHDAGINTAYVSNGFGTPQGLEKLSPHLDAMKIDLKAFSEETYKDLGGHLQPVLDTITTARELGIWVEVVTLLVPDLNDSEREIWDLTRFLAGISLDIPWHVTAFHPDYKMTDRSRTTAQALQTAAEIGQEAGLRYVYAGNLPGRVGSLENTYCPRCQKELITRRGFTVGSMKVTNDSTCPNCQQTIAGYFASNSFLQHYSHMV
jgi:pyruvate formate lyase activating enzyme